MGSMKRYREIPSLPGYYINPTGDIWDSRRRRHRKLYCHCGRYFVVTIKHERRFVHHLVLETFVGPRPEGMFACHKNDNPTDNRVENLYWGTNSDNQQDCVKNGHHEHKNFYGEDHPNHKLSRQDVLIVRELRQRGMPVMDIANLFSISVQHTSDIIGRRRWKWLS